MKNRIAVTARGYYRNAECIVRARNAGGFLEISKGQIKRAQGLVCYAGTDSVQLDLVSGYGEWIEYCDGSFVAQRV